MENERPRNDLDVFCDQDSKMVSRLRPFFQNNVPNYRPEMDALDDRHVINISQHQNLLLLKHSACEINGFHRQRCSQL